MGTYLYLSVVKLPEPVTVTTVICGLKERQQCPCFSNGKKKNQKCIVLIDL